MNYRHQFHAGNHADVLKHVVLLALIEALQRKPAPLFFLDTHAGRGEYDLAGEAARKTDEASSGIDRLGPGGKSDPIALHRYLAAVNAFRGAQTRRYPGSPMLIRGALRANDRLACCELHPEEFAALSTTMTGDRRVAVHARDGFEALGAFLPPPEKRALVLIDPPYEAQLAEFDRALPAIENALRRMPAAVIALWYPIKDGRVLRPVLRRAARLPAKTICTAELCVRADDSPLRLNGSAMLICNPPWQIDAELQPALRELARLLGTADASSGLRWLKTEEHRR